MRLEEKFEHFCATGERLKRLIEIFGGTLPKVQSIRQKYRKKR